MDRSDLYEADFLAWTEQQAAALRALGAASNSLDVPNLAEEIESLGRRDVREVESLIRQIMLHMLKLVSDPHSEACRHWRIEVAGFQADARSAFSPSMAQKIDVDVIWQRTVRLFVAEYLAQTSRWVTAPPASPISLDEFVGREFDVSVMVTRVASNLL